jgi:hypothetical protein
MSFGRLRRVFDKVKGFFKGIWNKGLKPLIVSAAPAVGTAIGGYLGGAGGASVGNMLGGTVGKILGGKQMEDKPVYSSPGGSENMVRLGNVGQFLQNRS